MLLLLLHVKISLPFKILQVLFVSSVKFLLAPLDSIELGFNYYQTFILTTIGGIGGVIFFFYLSSAILEAYDLVIHWIRKTFSQRYRKDPKKHKKPRKVFSRRTRFLIKLRGKYGMVGIAILTPVILSIPIGTFLAYKYYKDKGILWYLSISVVFWSAILSAIYFFYKF